MKRVVTVYFIERDDGFFKRSGYVDRSKAEEYIRTKLTDPSRWKVTTFTRDGNN